MSMHKISFFIIFFALQYVFSLNQCYFSTNSSVVHGQIFKENYFYEEASATLISCMKMCLRFSICLSINFLEKGKCQLNYNTWDAEPSNFVYSEESRYIRKSDILMEFTAACQHHSCKMDEMCHNSKISGLVCVKFGVCAGNPSHAANAVYKLTYSQRVKTAEYSCIYPAVHAGGDTFARCQIPDGWTEPQIHCTTEVPAACGDPPTIATPSTKSLTSQTIARYTCLTLSDTTPVEHCPVSKCIGVRNWTKPTISCSEYDCPSNTYSGRSTCSKDGHPCLVWSVAGGRQYSFLGNNNYCFRYQTTIPWCIVDLPPSYWQYCHVPSCGTG